MPFFVALALLAEVLAALTFLDGKARIFFI